jgi:hypothetical protein
LGVIAAVAGANGGAFAGETASVALDEIKAMRHEAAHKARRILYDNDGNEPVYYLKNADADELIDKRTRAVVGTQVDAIAYCTWSSGFSMFTHNTKVGEIFTCTEPEPGGKKGFSLNKTQAFIDKGTDPLEIIVNFCRENDIEVFWSMRMNDCHDAWGAWYSPFLFPQLKKDHPEWLMGTAEDRPVNGTWTAVDYGQPEIRDLAFKFFEEVCNNYDVDGLQMDFFRHLNYFRPLAEGGVCGQAERDMMTGLIRRIRVMADEVGAKRGRPILLSVRVPDSLEMCLDVGFDVERWMKEGLIDILTVSGYFRLNPWETSAALAHKYDTPVYASLSESRVKDKEAKSIRTTLEAYRARAMNVWHAGMDGVYMFNFFKPEAPHWSELGSPETLAPLDKVYTTGARGYGNLSFWYEGGEKYMNRDIVNPQYPRTLSADEEAKVVMPVGEVVGAHPPVEVTLRLRFKEAPAPEALTVAVNGTQLVASAQDGQWIDYPVAPEVVEKGDNAFTFGVTKGNAAKPVLIDMLLWVRHPDQPPE